MHDLEFATPMMRPPHPVGILMQILVLEMAFEANPLITLFVCLEPVTLFSGMGAG